MQKKYILLSVQENEKEASRLREIAVLLFAACAILLIFNLISLVKNGIRLKENILTGASAGFEQITNAATILMDSKSAPKNFEKAKLEFKAAQQTFEKIQNTAWFISPDIPWMRLNDPVFEAGNNLVSAGRSIAKTGALFAQIAENLHELPKKFFDANVQKAAPQESLTEKLKSQIPQIKEAVELLLKANKNVQALPSAFVPAQLKDKFNFAKNALGGLSASLSELNADLPAILALLGDKQPHTFLVLLQNSAELRPTGGFIGNYMIFETNDGYITKNDVFDVYSADHQLAEIITPPDEIKPVNNRWFLRDSNYSAHFPLSALASARFLEKENGPGVDSVISIDQTFVENLLALTGPVSVPKLSQPLTKENFSTVLSYIIEAKLLDKDKPKSILRDFLPVFQKQLFSNIDPIGVAAFLKSAIESKNVLAYSKDENVQKFFVERGMAGLMKNPDAREDYLNIVHTSISGNKSDAYIAEKITHDTYINYDGSLINGLEITRSHLWNEETYKKLTQTAAAQGLPRASKKLIEILGGADNVHMLRIYVPKGSVLEASSDKDISVRFDEETQLTYFSVKMLTPKGQNKTLRIKYKLPFSLALYPIDNYKLTIQKQAGQNNVTFKKRMLPAVRVVNYKYFPEDGGFDPRGVWTRETAFERDMDFSSVWGK